MVELGLWNALTETVQKWMRGGRTTEFLRDSDVEREFLADLTTVAFHVAQTNGGGDFLLRWDRICSERFAR